MVRNASYFARVASVEMVLMLFEVSLMARRMAWSAVYVLRVFSWISSQRSRRPHDLSWINYSVQVSFPLWKLAFVQAI